MLFTTPTQFVVLALLLVAGWFFGLASHPGGRKWRTRYEEERAAHAAYRREVEEHRKLHEERIAELERRNRTLEEERHAATIAPAAVRTADVSDRDVHTGMRGEVDDLSRIRGIDSTIESRLRAEGVDTYAQLDRIPASDEAALEDWIGVERGSMARGQWKDQATLLAANRDAEWRERFA